MSIVSRILDSLGFRSYEPPKCRKCGEYCQYYGPVGGYSVACVKCNEKNAARQRAARSAVNGEAPK